MGICIAAIPEEEDNVWRVSSEKIAHMTLLYLDDGASDEELAQIILYVQHAAAVALEPFHMSVNYRGVLGEDSADVLFFEKQWDFGHIERFRHALLVSDLIQKYQNEKFPEWLPHLTLGYPNNPAKEALLPSGRPVRLYGVGFDRVAVWTGDYDGPTFRLEHRPYDASGDLAMAHESGKDFIENELLHYGVKGMKWGKRKAEGDSGPAPDGTVSVTTGHNKTGKTTVSTAGGSHAPASADAKKAAESRAKLANSGLHSLSNKELKDLQTRLQLENSVSQLTKKPDNGAKKFIKTLLADTGKQTIRSVVQQETNKQVAAVMSKR